MGTATNEVGFALWDFIGDFGISLMLDWYGCKLEKKIVVAYAEKMTQ